MAYQDFIVGLTQMGYTPRELGPGRVAINYTIPAGRFAGKEIALAFKVGNDFPANPPGGPVVSPRLLPIHPKNDPHPDGGVHEAPEFGAEWEYWSRPHNTWPKTDRSVKAYMLHVQSLFATIP
jgi:hypothetical protein